MQVIELGELPPPFGGVSVHLKRLTERLAADGHNVMLVARRSTSSIPEGVAYVPWPTLPRYLNHLEFLRGLWSPFGAGVLHIHGNPVFFAPLACLHVRRGGGVLVTVHDEMVGARLSRALPHEKLCFHSLTQTEQVRWVAVSEPVRSFLIAHGVPEDRITVTPAFLSVGMQDGATGLPAELDRFLARHGACVVVYGYRMACHGGQDLYGFGFALEVFAQVRYSRPDLGMIILCPQGGEDPGPWARLRGRADELGIASDVCFFLRPLPGPLALWSRCQVMLRPSLTDGDAVAVREMLAAGGAVIASSAAPRPAGTVVLPVGDERQWVETIMAQLAQPPSDQRPIAKQTDGYEAVKGVLLRMAEECE